MELNFKKYGDSGEPLIIIHGLLGMLDNWSSHARFFKDQGYRVYLVDARNHGRSPWSDEMNYEVMMEDLKEFLDSQSINEAHLLGHSMGGKIVMKFAQNYAYRVKKLIVADISPMSYPVHHELILKGLRNVPLDKIEKRTEADEFLAEYIKVVGIRQFLMKSLHRKKDKTFGWRFNLDAIEANIERMGDAVMDSRYQGKTLFIRGGASDYIKDNQLDELKVSFPNSEIKTIEKVGHWLHAEEPKVFDEYVIDFLG